MSGTDREQVDEILASCTNQRNRSSAPRLASSSKWGRVLSALRPDVTRTDTSRISRQSVRNMTEDRSVLIAIEDDELYAAQEAVVGGGQVPSDLHHPGQPVIQNLARIRETKILVQLKPIRRARNSCRRHTKSAVRAAPCADAVAPPDEPGCRRLVAWRDRRPRPSRFRRPP
jgi:hypothetical protein